MSKSKEQFVFSFVSPRKNKGEIGIDTKSIEEIKNKAKKEQEEQIKERLDKLVQQGIIDVTTREEMFFEENTDEQYWNKQDNPRSHYSIQRLFDDKPDGPFVFIPTPNPYKRKKTTQMLFVEKAFIDNEGDPIGKIIGYPITKEIQNYEIFEIIFKQEEITDEFLDPQSI